MIKYHFGSREIESPNTEIIDKYNKHLESQGICGKWRKNKIDFLRRFPGRFEDMNKQGIVDFVQDLESSPLTRSKTLYKMMFREFWTWFKGSGEDVAFMLPKRMRTPEDRKRISEALRKRYSQHTEFVRTRNKLRYKNAYSYERRIKYLLERIKESEMPDDNRKILIKYKRHLALYTVPGNVYNNIRATFRFFTDFREPFDKITENDALGLYGAFMKRDVSDYTKATEIGRLKQFLTWLNDDEPPTYLRKMKVRKKLAVFKNVSLSDVQRFLNNCESDEEKAYFAVLWEGCFSAGELLKVRHRDLNVHDGLVEIYVEGKDRNRIIPILGEKGRMFPLGSYELLLAHINKIKKPKPEDRIWSMEAYAQIRYRVYKIRNKAGLPHIKGHSFRKSRATYNVSLGMSTLQVAVFGGWSMNSSVLNHYVARSGVAMVPFLVEANKQ
jgi:integrase